MTDQPGRLLMGDTSVLSPTIDKLLAETLFHTFAKTILEAMEPGHATFARSLAEDTRLSESDVRWTLKGLASVNLVERRGGYWRLTEWGEQARAGDEAPEGWTERVREWQEAQR